MPRYKLIVEYDGGPFIGWQSQADGARCRARWRPRSSFLRRAGAHSRRRAHRHRRACAGQVAHVDLEAAWPDRVRDALNAHLRPHPVGILAAELVPDDVRRALLGEAAALPLPDRQPPRRLALDMAGLARAGPLDAGRCTRPRRGWSASTISPPSAPPNARPSPEKTLDQLDVTARRRRHLFLGALVPAQPGALDGRLAGLGGRGPLDRRRSAQALEDRSRPACGPVAPPDGLYLMRVDY